MYITGAADDDDPDDARRESLQTSSGQVRVKTEKPAAETPTPGSD